MNPTLEQPSQALLAYAGQLYTAFNKAVGGMDWADDPLPPWHEYASNPTNTRRVEGWVAVAKVACKIETEIRDQAL